MKQLASITIGMAALALAVGYALVGRWPGVLGTIVVGGVWVAGIWYHWAWINLAGPIALMGLAALAVYLQLSPFWPLLSVVSMLVGWDLANFAHRLSQIDSDRRPLALQLSHLRRLAGVVGVGLLLGGLTLFIQLPLTFGWAALLGLLMVVGLSWVMRFIQQR